MNAKNRLAGFFRGAAKAVWFLDREGHMVIGRMVHAEAVPASGEPDPGMTLADELGMTVVRMHVHVGDEQRLRVVDRPEQWVLRDECPVHETPIGGHSLDGWAQEVDVPPTFTVEPAGRPAGGLHRVVTFDTPAEHLDAVRGYVGRRVRWHGRVWMVNAITQLRHDYEVSRVEWTLVEEPRGTKQAGRRPPVHMLSIVNRHGLVEQPSPEQL